MSHVLSTWVVYHDTKDYPGGFVVREHQIHRGHGPLPCLGPLYLWPTLEEARDFTLPDGVACIGRFPEDDPKIVEVWL